MTMRDQILAVARAFGGARRLSPSRVSTLVFNDGKKIGRLEGGADLQTGNFEQAMAWFSGNWPDDAEWPDDVPRPESPDDDEPVTPEPEPAGAH